MATPQATKTWGGKEFCGLSWDYDPQWLLNEEQKEIQAKLIETCRTVVRPNAVSVESNAILITSYSNVQNFTFPQKLKENTLYYVKQYYSNVITVKVTLKN